MRVPLAIRLVALTQSILGLLAIIALVGDVSYLCSLTMGLRFMPPSTAALLSAPLDTYLTWRLLRR